MRVALATVLGIAITGAVVVLVKSGVDSRRDEPPDERGRQEGLKADEEDIARGTAGKAGRTDAGAPSALFRGTGPALRRRPAVPGYCLPDGRGDGLPPG